MMMSVYIPHDLPDLNTVINQSKTHWSKYRKLKQSATDTCAWYAKRHLRPIGEQRVRICCVWCNQKWLKDPDNVSHAVKYILDGLVIAKILPNDNYRYISEIQHHFEVAKESGVTVMIETIPERK